MKDKNSFSVEVKWKPRSRERDFCSTSAACQSKKAPLWCFKFFTTELTRVTVWPDWVILKLQGDKKIHKVAHIIGNILGYSE